ncbi:MAG: hypothetical protein JRM85_07700, partial [Nitrososphaerota archaeon]|nr:hypothetical protein [Nitrososphaerota archaeon]
MKPTSKASEPATPAPPQVGASPQQAKVPSNPSSAAAPVAPNPDLDRAKDIAGRITSKYPGSKLEWVKPRRLKVSVPLGIIKDVAFFARDSLGFDHIGTVSGVDWIAKSSLEVVYFVGSTTPGQEGFVL